MQRVTAVMMAGKGDLLPVSAFPVDGTWPVGTAQWEKRNIAAEIPVWDADDLHPVQQVRAGLPARRHPGQGLRPGRARPARPPTFKSDRLQGRRAARACKYTLQVAPEDCTGCSLCVEVCPAKDKANPRHKAIDMAPQPPLREAERENYAFFLDLPELDRATRASSTSRARSSCSRSSSTRAPARAAARRRTSSS